jgi:tRNA A-37 threonylcarbamoyl transferase component Bud32
MYSLTKLTILAFSTIGHFSAGNYIRNNVLSPFTLFTIANECTRCIALYHNIYQRTHGNTTLNNFIIMTNNKCTLQKGIENNNKNKYYDYDIFFVSFEDAIKDKNKNFTKLLQMYKHTLYNSI